MRLKLSGKSVTVRVCIDVNVWISFLYGSFPDLIDNLEKHDIISSTEDINELSDVLGRPKFKKIPTQRKQLIIDYIRDIAVPVEIQERIPVCRDPKDDYLLDIAVNGKADYLITGVDDLLSMKEFRGTKIVTYREFKRAVSSVR